MNEKKLVRLCWNSNNWQKPSGKYGKTTNQTAYENIAGFGHEEWLFDFGKIISGYHYGFIQGVGKNRERFYEKLYDISLYSINSNNKTRWWLGELKNVKFVSAEESQKVLNIYKKKKWYKEMVDQLKSVGADYTSFQNSYSEYFTTIKFKIEDARLLDIPLRFDSHDQAVTSNYYNIKNFISLPKFSILKEFSFKSGHSDKSSVAVINYEAKEKELDLLHNRIQGKIYNQFCSIYKKENVGTEVAVNGSYKIDLVVKNKRVFNFYEIKTDNSVLKCIREALSQLLEYAYFPNDTRANKLVIISHNKITENVEKYLNHLRTKFNIPVFYQRFNIKTNLLEDKLY